VEQYIPQGKMLIYHIQNSSITQHQIEVEQYTGQDNTITTQSLHVTLLTTLQEMVELSSGLQVQHMVQSLTVTSIITLLQTMGQQFI